MHNLLVFFKISFLSCFLAAMFAKVYELHSVVLQVIHLHLLRIQYVKGNWISCELTFGVL